MNVTKGNTTEDPIVFANTFNAAQKLANEHLFDLKFDRDIQVYTLVSQVTRNTWATFGDVEEALSWMTKTWKDSNDTSTYGPYWA